MATIKCLPEEVIAIILGYNDISVEDIINFRCVCKQFRSAAKYDNYWEKKFYQRWPSAKKFYDKQSKENEQKESEENEQKEKISFMETGINCVRQLRNYVSQIIYEHYYDKSIDNVKNRSIINYIHFREFCSDKDLFCNICAITYKSENFMKYSFFIDEIKNLLTQSPRRTSCDLTERYCNIKIFDYMRQEKMEDKWDRYQRQPDREQLFERIATILAQWFQPQKDIFYSYVKALLDSIALEVLSYLREKHPDHSIFSTSAETFSYWKNNNIDDNHWNEAEGTQIMDILMEYIFGKLNFQRSESEDTNFECMCIDNVLKNKYGHEVILLIIYQSVARRLGLRCDVIRFAFHYSYFYSIFWKPNYATNGSENVRCFSISFKKFPDCVVNQLSLFRTLEDSREPTENIFVMCSRRMHVRLPEIFADLTYRYDCSYGIFEHRGTCMLRLRFKTTALEQLSTRPKNVKFAVGMIVTHDNQSTDSCTGVIVGWHRHVDTHVWLDTYMEAEEMEDEEMKDEEMDDEHPRRMHISYDFDMGYVFVLPLNHFRNFKFREQQTNYLILIENNKMCYVEEDAISLTTPKWIENSEIGRYFCKFEDTHYVPNKMLARLYPQDAAITAKMLFMTTRSLRSRLV